ncbi:MAG TPA: DUF1697 domain-containing protein [Solirubrobacteraceae bacterium]|nr:DUF1697 domain-containing protein [Solirubrobacteraceae bacterium]
MAQLVALLRGINLAKSRRIAMADLRALLEEQGFEAVRTHLQSGNVVLASDDAPDAVAAAIAAAIEERAGMSVDVVVRTADELAAVVAANPLAGVASDGARHVVAFLRNEPDAAALRALAEEDFGPERFEARGREIYAWCPNGLQKSPLLKAIGARLGKAPQTATVRNWNTVTKLAAMADEDR